MRDKTQDARSVLKAELEAKITNTKENLEEIDKAIAEYRGQIKANEKDRETEKANLALLESWKERLEKGD